MDILTRLFLCWVGSSGLLDQLNSACPPLLTNTDSGAGLRVRHFCVRWTEQVCKWTWTASVVLFQHCSFVGREQREATEERHQTQVAAGAAARTDDVRVQPAGTLGRRSLPGRLHTSVGSQEISLRK